MNPLAPLPPDEFGPDEANHLLARAGFGGSPEQVRHLAAIGLDRSVELLLDWDRLPDEPAEEDSEDRFDRSIIRPPTPEEREIAARARRENDREALDRAIQLRQQRQMQDRRQLAEMRSWWLRRMIETGRPLQEKLVLFWHGHFTSGHREVEDSWLLYRQNRLFRQHAAGSFRNLLREVLRDPAMLKYLDNDRNVARSPNENLARELLELFTLGEGVVYREPDIREAARALTGHGVGDDEFQFARRQHDDGIKTILGERGPHDADALVEIILARREASEFLASRILRFFVNDFPAGPGEADRSATLAIAASLRRHKWHLRPVLRQLFASRYFHAPANRGMVIKSPIDLIVSSIRSLGTPARSLPLLLAAADRMGQNLFQPPTVRGWPGGRAWINTSTLFVRQNLLVYLLTGRVPTGLRGGNDRTPYDPLPLLAAIRDLPSPEPSSTGVAEPLLRFCLGGVRPRPERVREVEAMLATACTPLSAAHGTGILCLVTSLPEYQLC